MKTKSGILELTKAERNALQIIKQHVETDISYKEGGTFLNLNNPDTPDKKEIKKAEKGIDVIDFILQITE